MDKSNFDIKYFRELIENEKIISLDFSYLIDRIEEAWEYMANFTPVHIAKFQIIQVILKYCKAEHMKYFDKLGLKGISAICIANVFKKDCPKLSLVVHEALSELFALNDIRYPYEDHKKLYLKAEGVNYKNWGNGYGEITPHSDDLYEDIDADYLSLTVCRDHTNTPTKFYLPKDIFSQFSDDEINQIINMRVKFISGKNVNKLKCREREMVKYSEDHGFLFCMDFRIDNDIGERMTVVNDGDAEIFKKLKLAIYNCPSQESISKTGTFLIVANYKVLHARGEMNINPSSLKELPEHFDASFAPRLLYRSKGQECKLTQYI